MSKLSDLVKLLMDEESFCFDTETAPMGVNGDALDPHGLELVGISFCTRPGNAFYIPIPADQIKCMEILNQLRCVFAAGKTIIAFNAKFDLQVLKYYGVEVVGKIIDPMVADYLTNPDKKKHGLKELSMQLLNYKQTEISELIGKQDEKRKTMREVPVDIVSKYACEDVDQTMRIWYVLKRKLESMGLMKLFTEVEMPLIPCIAEMEYHGVRVNGNLLRSYFKRADDDQDMLAERIFEIAGQDFNIASSAQLSRLFYDVLDLAPIGERGASGNYSVGKSVLNKLPIEQIEEDKKRDAMNIVPLIAKYKSNKSIIDNFLIKLPRSINKLTGNMHAKVNQVAVSTGRLSSSQPNLQNIPKQKKGLGSSIRDAFVSVTPGNKIVSVDFSQIEVRVLAHCSQDKNLIEAFKNGIDIHTAVAAKTFQVPISEVTEEKRAIAKSVVFGLNYGMKAKGLGGRLTEVLNRKVDEYEAEDYIESYFEQFPGVKVYQEECIYQASVKGYTETILGRKRFLPDINSYEKSKRESAMRIALNAPIQGSAADIIKVAMVRIFGELQSKKLKTKMVLQVHDELVFDADVNELPFVLPMIKSHMEDAITLIVPMEVVIKVGDNWNNGEKWIKENE